MKPEKRQKLDKLGYRVTDTQEFWACLMTR